MAKAPSSARAEAGPQSVVAECLGGLASLKLAVALLVGLAITLAVATILEAREGAAYAYWFVYGSPWFVALWGLLGLNVLAAVVTRYPWKLRLLGFLLAHVGVLVILAGAWLSWVKAINGKISLREGQTADSLLVPDRSQLTLGRQGEDGMPPMQLAFAPGPVDWPKGESLDFGRVGDVGLRVLAYYHHARPNVNFVADESESGPAAIKLGLSRSAADSQEELWCIADPFGGHHAQPESIVLFRRAPVATMAEDFLEPPNEGLGERGVLAIHYQGERRLVPVDENLGQKIPISEDGVAVELVAYYAHSELAGKGRFRSLDDSPENPMLELEVYLPDKEPIQEIAYANNPFVTFALMRGTSCPVRFWYHHPAVRVLPGAEFLQTPDGKLFYRVGAEGEYRASGEVKVGDRIELSDAAEARLLAYLPHARREVTYTPSEDEQWDPAALVEVSLEDESHQVWLSQGVGADAPAVIRTSKGPLLLALGCERIPLGFSVKLVDFVRELNPGRMGDRSYTSVVRLVDPHQGIEERKEISMNKPATHGPFRFFQSGFDESPGGGELSVLSVAYDPGRLPKYLGSLMVCLGIFVHYYLRGLLRGKKAAGQPEHESPGAR